MKTKNASDGARCAIAGKDQVEKINAIHASRRSNGSFEAPLASPESIDSNFPRSAGLPAARREQRRTADAKQAQQTPQE